MVKVSGEYQTFFIYLILAIITRVAFWQVHSFGFLNYDDGGYVSKNEHISTGLTWNNIAWVFTSEHEGNWHPLTGLSHLVDCQLFGLRPGLHHLVNLLFHITNALLLFTVLRLMTSAFWRSAFVAALFAIHPLHVESVAWVSERKDVLSTLFLILTVLAYFRYVKNPKAGSYTLTLMLFTLGLTSKPMLVTLPFVLLLLDYWPLNRLDLQNSREIYRLVREKIPFFILATISSVVTFLVQQSGGAVQEIKVLPMAVRATNAIVSYWKYILKVIWPADLAVFYPHTGSCPPYWQVFTAAIALVVITIGVIRCCKKYKYLPMGWFWYLGTLVPVIGLVQVGDQLMADRYTYITTIGLFIIIVWGANDLLRNWKYKKITLEISAAAIILVLTICTSIQANYWRSSETLFRHTLKVTNGNYVAYNGLGLALIEQNKFDEAVNQLEQAVQFNPDCTEAYNNLGIAYSNLGRYEDAIQAYKQATQIKPNYAEAYYNLGTAHVSFNHSDDAIKAYQQAIQIEPDYVDAHYNLGVVYLMAGDKAAALQQYEILKNLDPHLANQLSELMNK